MKKLTDLVCKIFNIKYLKNEINKVEMDSRLIAENDIFFAINNGKNYIEDVLKKGALLVITDDKKYLNNDNIIIVEDVIATFQKLALEYRKILKIKVVGIVGSNGKTTTKDIVYSLISAKYKTKKTIGNYNNHIGVPYTILQLGDEDEVAVIEMGMSNFGEIKVLCDIASPDYGIITNIGDSHLEFMKTRKNVFVEKSEIKNYVKKENLIFYGDDEYLKKLEGIKVGFFEGNDYRISSFKETKLGCTFLLNGEEYKFRMNGKHNSLNSSFAIALADILKINKELIKETLYSAEVTPMRFERLEKNGINFINDAYNASPISMNYSLETLNSLESDRGKIAVLADMGELGEEEIKFHREVLENAVKLENVEKIIITGSRMLAASKYILDNRKIIFCEDKEAVKNIILKKFSDKLILLKGSNFNHLWEIIK